MNAKDAKTAILQFCTLPSRQTLDPAIKSMHKICTSKFIHPYPNKEEFLMLLKQVATTMVDSLNPELAILFEANFMIKSPKWISDAYQTFLVNDLATTTKDLYEESLNVEERLTKLVSKFVSETTVSNLVNLYDPFNQMFNSHDKNNPNKKLIMSISIVASTLVICTDRYMIEVFEHVIFTIAPFDIKNLIKKIIPHITQ